MSEPSYAEESDSPKEQWTEKGFTATRRLRVAWANRKALVDALMGQTYAPIANTGSRCIRCGVEPFTARNYGTTNQSIWEHAIVTAEYGTDEVEDLISEEISPTAEILALDYKLFRWGANNGPAITKDEAPGQMVRGLEYVVTKYQVASVPAEALSLAGFVNSGSLTPSSSGLSGWTFAAGSLMCQPAQIKRVIKSDGSAAWDITYKFIWKPNWTYTGGNWVQKGWNWYWRAATQTYVQIYIAGGAVYNQYPSASFSTL